MGQEPHVTNPEVGSQSRSDPELRGPDPTGSGTDPQAQDPQAIRQSIASTRQSMDRTLDELGDRVSPRRMARRRADQMRASGRRLRDTMAGVVGGGSDHGPRSNPLGAGLVAFGAGLLAGSALPRSEAEQRVTSRVQDQAEPVTGQLADAAREVREHVQPAAKEAMEETKQAATQAAGTVKDEARQTAPGGNTGT